VADSALVLLAHVAAEFDARPLPGGAAFEVPVREVSGETRTYHLTVNAIGELVAARETVPHHLPAACPERHINGDGTFCVHWERHESGRVVDEASAKLWWVRLLAFLKAQRRAERARRWTAGKAWAHGRAAVHQTEAERAASCLGADFEDALNGRHLSVEWSKHKTKYGDRLLYLARRGQVVLAARGKPLRIVNKRLACICERGDIKRHRRLRNCGAHAQDALALINAMLGWQEEEKRFWEGEKARTCCRTMDSCPLNTRSRAQSKRAIDARTLAEA